MKKPHKLRTVNDGCCHVKRGSIVKIKGPAYIHGFTIKHRGKFLIEKGLVRFIADTKFGGVK